MQGLSHIFLVAASLGMDNFAAAVGFGVAGVGPRDRFRIAIAFGLFESGMPLIGLLIGKGVAGPLGNAGKYAGAGLLIIIGLVGIFKSIVHPKRRRISGHMGNQKLLLAALAISIDNLLIGFALSLNHSPIVLSAVVIAIFSIAFSLIGMELGSRLGAKLGRWGELGGGIALTVVGIAMAIGRL